MAEPVSDELNGSMFLLRDSKPGDLVLRRRLINGDTYVEVALRPVAGSVMTFDTNLRPSIEPLAGLASYQSLVNVANDATRLLLTTEFVRDGSRVYVMDTGRYWDVVDSTELPGAAAFVEILTSAALATANDAAATATAQAALAEQWAAQTSGIVDATDYSAKEFARGTQAGTGGSAKNWAQQTGADVTGASANSRSAKSWAQDNNTGTTLGGSAKDWAQSSSLPDGTSKSAKSYATDAAASAAAVAQQFKGGIAGNSVPATSTLAGDYYRITSAGTSQSKTWVIGDQAIYSGTSGNWTQITGFYTIATAATTDSSTGVANTAFVQAVAGAGYTQPTALSITAAGNSNVAASTAQNRYLTQRINVTAFTGTATVTVQSASAIAGDKRRFIVSMPAGLSNNIELRNLTSGGTLLATVPMDGALARTWLGYSTFDGTNWGAVSFSPMSVDEFVLARTLARMDYIQSDGATSNRASGIYGPFDAVNNPREYVAGAATLTIAAVMTVPSATWSDDSYICGFISNTAPVSTPINEFNALILSVGNSSNNLRIIQRGSVVGNFRLFDFANFRSTYSGQTGFLKAYFVQGSTNPVVSWNGVDISSSFSASTGGTPPSWLDATMVPTYRLNGFRWPSGPAPIVTPILGTTSAADDAFYMATGKWPAWVVAGGSCASVTAGSFVVRGVYLITSIGTTDFTLIGAASNTVGVQFTATGVGTGTGTAQRAGALSLPSIQPINVVDDVSGIGGNQGRILGGTPVTDKRSTRILGRINAASATNQQILGGALLPVPLNHAIEFVDVETDGSVTLSLGDGTTATRYTASTALTAGRTRIALSTPFAADSAKTGLYVNVTVAGGTYAQFSILGHILK